jgi:carboxypeptidase A4
LRNFFSLYPWGYDRKVPADHQDLDRVGKEAAAAIKAIDGKDYTVGPAGSTLYPAAGGSDDWAKGDLKFKYSYTIELRDEGKGGDDVINLKFITHITHMTGRYGFMLPANQIIKTGEESMAFVRVIARAAARA